MDVCKTATAATEIPHATLDHLLAEQAEQRTIVLTASDGRKNAANRLEYDSPPSRTNTPLETNTQLENKWVQPSPDHMTVENLIPSAVGLASVADYPIDDTELSAREVESGEELSTKCQEEPEQPHDPSTASSMPLTCEKTDDCTSLTPVSTDSMPIMSTTTDNTPLTPIMTDDSMSSTSEDAIADCSQSSNLEWTKCQASTRRTSSASASSSTATISPSDTLAGACTTDESLSSDETALDLSQNSFESTKYQSDLESVSVSSIVRKTTPCTANEMIEDASRRRVSFPMKDSDLVTGYMEPANPWESATNVTTSNELINLYKNSCLKHHTTPLDSVILHLKTIELEKSARHDRLDLKEIPLTPEACEAMEEILKRVQYQTIDLTRCKLNDTAASAIFDMIEFYESAVEVDISENPSISSSGIQSCISMIRKSSEIRSITLRGNPLSELHATNLGKAINTSNLHTLKLEHCGLTGRPVASLCNTLRNSKTLKELWLAHNDLFYRDAIKIADLLKANGHLQFLDVSNNKLEDAGIRSIAIALIEQAATISITLKRIQTQERLKAIEFRNSFSDATRNVQSLDSSQENEKPETIQQKCTTNGGNRSMLDALLQMQPGECKEPVQMAAIPSNNNVGKLGMENDPNEVVTEKLTSREPSEEKVVVDKLEPIEEILGISKSDVETTVSSSDSVETTEIRNEDKIVVNNNTTKHTTDDNNSLLPGSIEESSRKFDLNENKDNNINNSETLLINILDDSANKEALSRRTYDSISSSPMIFERPSSVDDYERHQKDDIAAYTTRSQSCDSLSSDNSLDAIETHLSAEIKEKITKNDTLGRQQKLNQNNENLVDNTLKPPRGLQALILWNNNLTRVSGECIADMIASTNSLEILNIGKNTLSNDFINTISNSLKYNKTLTNLGLQSTHLNSVGIIKLADILQFGGNNTLERIDIRDNNVQVAGLVALCDALKSNKRVSQIDIDDEPKRYEDDGDGRSNYSKYLQTVRSLIDKNQSSYETPKIRNSRKISLTCHSIHTPTPPPVINVVLRNDSLDVKKKSGARLRSPLPSPPTASPSSSPVPSPSRGSRFQVSRVSENGKNGKLSSSAPQFDTKPIESLRSSPSPTSRFRVTMVKLDDSKDVQMKKEKPYVCGTISTQTTSTAAQTTMATGNGTNDIRFVFPDVAKVINPIDDKTTVKVLEESTAPEVNVNESQQTDTSTIVIEKAKDAVLEESTALLTNSTNVPITEAPKTTTVEIQATLPIPIPCKEAFVEMNNQMIMENSIEAARETRPLEKVDEKDSVDKTELPTIHEVVDPMFERFETPVVGITENKDVTVILNPLQQLQDIVPPPIHISDIPIIVGEEESETEISITDTHPPGTKSETRVRKSSWNAPATAVDKLSNFIQQISSNIFNRSNSSESDKKSSESSDSLNNFSDVLMRQTTPSNDDRVQLTKTSQSFDTAVSQSKTQTLLEAASKQFKEFKDFGKQVLHMAPMQATQQSLPAPYPPPLSVELSPAPWEESPSLIVAMDHYTTQVSRELDPTHINIEIKENISPQHHHHQQQQHLHPSFNSSSCVHSHDLPNSDELLKLDSNHQIVDLQIEEKKMFSESTVSAQNQLTHGNDKHDL